MGRKSWPSLTLEEGKISISKRELAEQISSGFSRQNILGEEKWSNIKQKLLPEDIMKIWHFALRHLDPCDKADLTQDTVLIYFNLVRLNQLVIYLSLALQDCEDTQ